MIIEFLAFKDGFSDSDLLEVRLLPPRFPSHCSAFGSLRQGAGRRAGLWGAILVRFFFCRFLVNSTKPKFLSQQGQMAGLIIDRRTHHNDFASSPEGGVAIGFPVVY